MDKLKKTVRIKLNDTELKEILSKAFGKKVTSFSRTGGGQRDPSVTHIGYEDEIQIFEGSSEL